jgi:predicted ArsR family transcriptional regulator
MEQQDLLDPNPRTLARTSDPGTSKEAAARVREFAGTHYSKIVAALVKLGGPSGAEQIAAYSKIDAYQVRKRLPELQRQGVVERMDLSRQTASGRHENLWRLK